MEQRNKKGLPRAVILETRIAPVEDGYIPVTLVTEQGSVACRYYPIENGVAGVIWVGGVGGGWDTPAQEMYPALSEKLQGDGIASLRVRYRYPHILEEAVHDVAAGIRFLEREGIKRIALVGHSFGGAVVIQSAYRASSVRTVVTLATQSYGAENVAKLPPWCSVLLMHGDEDRVLPYYASQHVYSMAHEPKDIIILQGNGHVLDESAQEVKDAVYEWIKRELTS